MANYLQHVLMESHFYSLNTSSNMCLRWTDPPETCPLWALLLIGFYRATHKREIFTLQG